MTILNPNFEDGDTGWIKGPEWSIVQSTSGAQLVQGGAWSARWDGGNGAVTEIINESAVPVQAGLRVTASCYCSTNGAGGSQGGVHVVLIWWDSTGNRIAENPGNIINSTGTAFAKSSVSAPAPSGASFVSVAARAYRNSNPRPYFVDTFEWNYVRDRGITLTAPPDGAEFSETDTIPLRVDVSGTQPSVVSVTYVLDEVAVRTVNSAPYGASLDPQTIGEHEVYARLNLADGTTIITETHTFNVVEVPTPPTLREFKASNSYTYLAGENFQSLGAAMPPTSKVVGVEVLLDYSVDILVRSLDVGAAPEDATYNVAFAIAPEATVEAVLLDKQQGRYMAVGSSATEQVGIEQSDFTVMEDGLSDGKRWTALRGEMQSVTVGSEDFLFGIDPPFGDRFKDYVIGVRFVPIAGSIPSYAASGDAVYRFKVNSFKVRVYFDAGSVEYYFASPDRDQVIKGTLVSANVLSGDFRTADAEGILQLTSELEIIDGDQMWIGNDWTIHAAYPPTDSNYIGDVATLPNEDLVGMEYNGLPTQKQMRANRSRYQIITANFYGDKELNSMYGANGLSRAFAHNGKWFYQIFTQPDEEKDKPRHVAYHHWHLALGYDEGRVDISVVGEPYNFDGALGASSWTIGDQVVGLLPLSGTILGVFGSKSVWGISGTTVDNFATQVISPNIGATEYTICDMGLPVYANAYGIYTLQQTQQYGDYLGVPLSQDISPWLRPRLVRKYTTEREVEVAWPVRSKNQYRLAFSDGYVLSMTMNGQSVPTFSKQKYFLPPNAEQVSVFSEGAEFQGVAY